MENTTTPAPTSQRNTGPVEVRAQDWTFQHADRTAPALAGLNLHIRPGEKVLLAGASGAGKSTLLHGLAGVLHDEDASSSGQLLLDGLTPHQARGRAGLVQQDPESQVVLSRVGDDTAFAAENLGVPPAEIWPRVHESLAAVGLHGLDLDHPSAQLSGGQKQRLALAGILAMRPGLLLLDEPTANLDPEGVTQIRDAVIAAAEVTGATVIVVEHRVEIWAEHMDTLVVLGAGSGVRHQVPAHRIYQDAALRAELTGLGLWVPGTDPLERLSTWTPPSSLGTGLLTGRGLAVSRRAHKKPWRRTAPPVPALTGVGITVDQGQALGITGPNGAGKSTLLLSLAGLLPVHGGELIAQPALKGEAGTDLPENPHQWRSAELVARIGMVFQEPEHQFVRSTVRQELAFGAQQAALPGTGELLFTEDEVQARTDSLLERLGLSRLAEANPFTLSGGEKRRLSVGTALAAGCRLLVLDEPTFGQDAKTFAELIVLLREHLDEGGSVLTVTHDAAFLQALHAPQYDVTAMMPEPTEQRRCDDGTSSSTLPMMGAVRDTSWLGRRNPLAKLIGVLLITCALVASINWVSSAVIIATSFLLLPLAGIRPGTFLLRTWPFALGAVVAAWGTAIAAEESGQVLLNLGFTTISEGSVALGIALGLRAYAIVLPSVIVFSTTDPTDVADSLAQQLKLPTRFVLGALAAMRLVGLLAEHWTTLGHTRRARGIGAHGSAGRRIRATLSQAFGLLVQALRMAVRLAGTMESRGFGAGPRTWARPARFDLVDVPVILGGALISAAAVTAAVQAGVWALVW